MSWIQMTNKWRQFHVLHLSRDLLDLCIVEIPYILSIHIIYSRITYIWLLVQYGLWQSWQLVTWKPLSILLRKLFFFLLRSSLFLLLISLLIITVLAQWKKIFWIAMELSVSFRSSPTFLKYLLNLKWIIIFQKGNVYIWKFVYNNNNNTTLNTKCFIDVFLLQILIQSN